GAALGAFALAGCTETARAGTPPSLGAVSSALSGTGFLWVDTIAGADTNLRSLIGNVSPTSAVVVVGGYLVVGDGGGGVFFWDASSSTGDDAGTIIVPTGSTTGRWVRLFSGDINVKWFGARGDGTTDDTAAIQAALDYMA